MKIAIASGKGGTGKTTLSTNLAALFAETEEVVLADLDVEEPNSGLFVEVNLFHQEDKFKMIPEWKEDACTLCGICQDVCNSNAIIQLDKSIIVFPQLCNSCYACTELCPTQALPMIPQKMGELKHFKNGNLHFVESRLEIGQEHAVPLITQTLKYVQKHFADTQIQIFDSPPGTSCPVIEAVKDADLVILITEPTPFGLHDLKLAVETIRQLKRPFGVVINRDGIGNNDVLNYCREEAISVIARIPNNRRIAEIYSRGELIYPTLTEVRQQLEIIRSYFLNLKKGVEV
jgi:MinD superfamily P-loop ATPase